MLLRNLPYSALPLGETAKCFRGLLLCYKPKYDIETYQSIDKLNHPRSSKCNLNIPWDDIGLPARIEFMRRLFYFILGDVLFVQISTTNVLLKKKNMCFNRNVIY